MERLKHIQKALIDCVEAQVLCNIDEVDAKELGEVVDVIKDISETLYYHAITEAMEEGSEAEEEKHRVMYMKRPKQYPYEHGTKIPKEEWPMKEHPPSHEDPWMRDPDEGRSGERRKMYMKGKMDKDKAHQMKELENYMSELAQDMTEMIQDASPEEKALLQQKISLLAAKIK